MFKSAKKKVANAGNKDVKDGKARAWDQIKALSPEQAASLIRDQYKLPNVAASVVEHQISGELLPDLNDRYLKEMGVKTVGDRLRFMKEVRVLQMRRRIGHLKKVLYEGKGYVHWSIGEYLTCQPCCAPPPPFYKITNQKVAIRASARAVCACCAAQTVATNNIDLTNVEDVDSVKVEPSCIAKCCCQPSYGFVTITSKGDAPEEAVMVLKAQEAQMVSEMLQNAVEENLLRENQQQAEGMY